MSDLAQVLMRATNLLANSLFVLLIARVVLSWVYPNMRNTLVFWVWRLSEPFLAPLRRWLPSAGRMDWSPFVAMLLISVARAVPLRFFASWL
jgi:YggT family protein